MISCNDLINELSELCGILPEYWDIFGKRHITSIETKKAILLSMKLPISTFNTDFTEDIAREISERRKKPWKDFIEPVHIISVNSQPLTIPVYIPIKEDDENKIILSWSVEDERGHKEEFNLSGYNIIVSELKWIDGMRYVKVNLTDTKQRDLGYYSVNVKCSYPKNTFLRETDLLTKTTKVIITPDTCYVPSEWLTESMTETQRERTWGLSINLYSIRSDRNWGVGDFTDLKSIIKWIANLKGDFIGINPLHAISNTKPYGVSPYSPISRLYKNFIYLDVENIPDVKESSIVMSISLKKELTKFRSRESIDYEGIALLKKKVLKSAFNFFYKEHYKRDTHRGRDFKMYILKEGAALESFATYMAISECEVQKTKDGMESKAIHEFKKTNKLKALFYEYIQWLIDKQLKEVAEEAKASGMTIGLYHDLAIGSAGEGSDSWAYQDITGLADVGAPPDDFSPNGQNWGFPPLIPEKLKETGYELFIQTIRKNMKYGGAMRIDHALGIFRLFWIPRGMPPKEGAYVNYSSEDLLRIIALESVRNKTIVIAEDLGTIGENVRETLRNFNMLSYRLFYFERNYPYSSFVSPERYPEMALCAVTTHDLPTLYGYWIGQDLKVKKGLGMYTDEALWQQQIDERAKDKALILAALRSQGIISDNYTLDLEMTPDLCSAIYRYLAKTPCKLLLVSLDDIVGTINQQNMPGTIDEHPNWIQKTSFTLEEMVLDKRFKEVACQIRQW